MRNLSKSMENILSERESLRTKLYDIVGEMNLYWLKNIIMKQLENMRLPDELISFTNALKSEKDEIRDQLKVDMVKFYTKSLETIFSNLNIYQIIDVVIDDDSHSIVLGEKMADVIIAEYEDYLDCKQDHYANTSRAMFVQVRDDSGDEFTIEPATDDDYLEELEDHQSIESSSDNDDKIKMIDVQSEIAKFSHTKIQITSSNFTIPGCWGKFERLSEKLHCSICNKWKCKVICEFSKYDIIEVPLNEGIDGAPKTCFDCQLENTPHHEEECDYGVCANCLCYGVLTKDGFTRCQHDFEICPCLKQDF